MAEDSLFVRVGGTGVACPALKEHAVSLAAMVSRPHGLGFSLLGEPVSGPTTKIIGINVLLVLLPIVYMQLVNIRLVFQQICTFFMVCHSFSIPSQMFPNAGKPRVKACGAV